MTPIFGAGVEVNWPRLDAVPAKGPELRLVWNEGPGTHPFLLESQLAESLSRRHVVLLDISVWNRLADDREEMASALKSRLLRLKDMERIFCPLTPPTIWELRKQTGSLHRTAELMEELSENVTFRSLDQLASFEVDAFLGYLLSGQIKPLGTNEKFAPVLGYLAPAYELDDIGATPSHTTDLLHTSIRSVRLTTLIRMLGEKSSPPFPDGCLMSSASIQRRKIAGDSIQRARRMEMEKIARRVVLPLIQEKFQAMKARDRTLVSSRLLGLPRSRRYGSAIEHMLHFMPTLSAEVEVHTVSGMDITRQDSPNDFFDRELLIYALAYSGTFAAIDRWMTSLVHQSRRGGFPATYAHAASLAELERQLDGIR